MPKHITHILDEIKPALHAWNNGVYANDWKFEIDYSDDSFDLVSKLKNERHKILTRKDLDDGVYKAVLNPRYLRIVGEK